MKNLIHIQTNALLLLLLKTIYIRSRARVFLFFQTKHIFRRKWTTNDARWIDDKLRFWALKPNCPLNVTNEFRILHGNIVYPFGNTMTTSILLSTTCLNHEDENTHQIYRLALSTFELVQKIPHIKNLLN